MIDAYIKRFKSTSFAALLALLVGISLSTSRSGLLDAHEQARQWLWVSVALGAELGEGSAIVSIAGQEEREWRRQHPDRPRFGAVLDVVRNLAATEPVTGRIAATNHRILEFRSTPLAVDEAACRIESGEPARYCSRYTLSQAGSNETIVHFVYQQPAGSDGQWLAKGAGDPVPVDRAAAEDRVLRIAEPWVGDSGSAAAAFDALGARLRSQTIKLPVLNLDLPARLASLALALFALVCAYAVATSLAGLERVYDPAAQKEPWIAPLPTPAAGGASPLIPRSLPWISRFAAFAQVLLPALLLAVALDLSPTTPSRLAVAGCAVPAALLMLFSARSLAGLLRRMA